ncbi:hypothetical protein G4V62_17195 [Bacillaceae bacterium SIJ1]|uniref:DUF6483 family protein n=1 Tax=Litoribacterium kuwaitense TaxID=1398745 RepID=UPI0013EE1A29|nr:DUF6483 family protein [Litoribacterium kuwaitense]NGP46595.1 hypothetical protein [Litoribacterium kuwaitense]
MPMLRDDFIMRMFQSVTQLAARLAGLRAERNKADSEHLIDEAIKGTTGLSRQTVNVLPAQELKELFSAREDEAERIATLALLLLEEGDHHEAFQETEEAYQDYAKGFVLLVNALGSIPNKQMEAELNRKADDLLERLTASNRYSGWGLAAIDYYEEIKKRYDLAENVLFALAEEKPSEAVQQRGLSFYRQRLQEDEAVLQKRKLPKNEVLEGEADFLHLFK